MSLVIGTSGWSYDEWVGPFYDEKKGMLKRYVDVFRTVEIDSTFYRYPTSWMVSNWYRNAPPGFVYAAKLPQLITHEKELRIGDGVVEDTEKFLELMRPLAEKLGPILIQLPPKFRFGVHAEALDKYLDELPRNYRWAVEFRHRSWMRGETLEMLGRHGAAYTIVDEPLLPPETHVTADFAYIRWHGHGTRPWYNYEYGKDELEGWLPKVKEVTGKARRVYGYFNNHFKANAVKNAVEMLELLGTATPEQGRVLKKILEHKEKGMLPKGVKPLESFTAEGEGLSVADLLMRFTSTSRLQRAEEMSDEELTIETSTEDVIRANIRSYSIEVDIKDRILKHDCDDWQKGFGMKRMCKHVDRLFLSLPEGRGKEILTKIWAEKDSWRFE